MANFGISLLLRSIFRIKFVLHSKLLSVLNGKEVPVLLLQYMILLKVQLRAAFTTRPDSDGSTKMSIPWHRLCEFASGFSRFFSIVGFHFFASS